MKRVITVAMAAVFALSMTHVALAAEPAKAVVVTASTLDDGDKCKRTAFKTALVKSACKKGLKAAIGAMKSFVKKAKKATGEKVNCKSCHTGLKKDGYPLKADGLALYKKYKAAIDGAKVTPRLSETDQHAVEAWLR